MIAVTSDSSLLPSVLRYFEQHGMEMAPASPPFTLLAWHSKNPGSRHGVVLVDSTDRVDPDAIARIAESARTAGLERVTMFADGNLAPEVKQAALGHCISLIDRTELPSVESGVARPTPPPLPRAHHPAPAAGSGRIPPPLPILMPLHPGAARPKVKRSATGQLAILFAAVWIGGISISSMLRHSNGERKRESLLDSLAKLASERRTAEDLPVTATSPTYASSVREAYAANFRKRHRLDEIGVPGLQRLSDDFVKHATKEIPKVYLDQHKATLDAHTGELDRYPGLAALVTREIPNPAFRKSAYDWLIPRLEEFGDPVLTYRAKADKAILTKVPADAAAAVASFEALMQAFDGSEDFHSHLDDIVGAPGGFIFRSAPERALAAVEAGPRIPPWIKKIARGHYHDRAAWKARGTGFARTVSDEDWQVFFSQLALAEAAFLESWELHPHHPYVAAEMVGISNQGQKGRKETRLWFERALALRADYKVAYDSYLNSLMPRWGGSNLELKRFGQACLNPRLSDTAVPLYLLSSHSLRAKESRDATAYWRMLPSDEKRQILGMLEAKLASNSHPAHQRYYLSLKVAIHHLLGDYDGSAKVLTRLGEDLDPSAFANYRVSVEEIRYAAALDGGITPFKNPAATRRASP